MKRRDFLKLSALIIPALAVNLEVPGQETEIISPSKTFEKAYSKTSEAFQKGYEMGKRAMEGYTEGVQTYNIPSDRDEADEAKWKFKPLGNKEGYPFTYVDSRYYEDHVLIVNGKPYRIASYTDTAVSAWSESDI